MEDRRDRLAVEGAVGNAPASARRSGGPVKFSGESDR